MTGNVPVKNALEIGCGLGKGARLLVDKMGFEHVCAFDLEHLLVRRAKRFLPERYASTIAFFNG